MTRHRTGVTAKFRSTVTFWGIGLLCVVMLGNVGCSRNSSDYSQSPYAGDFYLTGIRPPAGDTDRLLRNAHYLKLMGKPEMALRELEAAHRQEPNNLRVLNALALAYDRVGEHSRAQKIYQQGLVLDAANETLNNNLCFSYYLAGQWEKAEACFRQALTRNSRNIIARNNLGLLLCRRGRTEEARRLWQETEGEMAARKKLQQVMVVLGTGESPRYAQLPQSTPAASAPLPSPSPAPKAARDTTPARVALAGSPAPKRPVPVTPPAQTREPLKPAAEPAASLAPKKPSPPVTAAKPKPVQPQAPAPALQPQRQPAPAAKSAPVVTRKIPAPPVVTAAAAKPRSRPAPAKRTADTDKKPAPAVKPPASPQPAKIKVSAAPAPGPLTPALLAQSGIVIENGSGAHKLARQTRTLLKEEGFRVVSIGNYRDFGMDQTVIYYSPEAEKVARALSAKLFPESRLEMVRKFPGNAQVKVVLGKDRIDRPGRADKSSLRAEKMAAGPGSGQVKAPVAAPTPAAAAPVAARPPKPAPAKVAAPAPKPASTKVTASKGSSKPYLTARDLIYTPIEIRNGSGAKNIAHKARTMLSQEGFNVARIGNHIDFGAETTIIYYHPAAEKIARNLSANFFSNCQLEQTANLPEEIAVKVLLGKDLLQRTDVMAKLEE